MKKNSKPLLSVVIPTLNEEKYLPDCLSSFNNQTFKNFEVIVSDGGSVDKTVKIAKKMGAKTIVTPKSTVTIARQKGMEKTSGEIIVGADADTIYPPTHLERIVNHFKSEKDIVAVGGGGVFEKRPRWAYWGWRIAYVFFEFFYRFFGVALYIPAFNLSFKKHSFEKIGGYNTYLDFGGDELDVLKRLKKIGKVRFDSKLNAYPSSRRTKVGFWKLMIKHTLIDYYLGYMLAKILRKPVIKGKPVR